MATERHGMYAIKADCGYRVPPQSISCVSVWIHGSLISGVRSTCGVVRVAGVVCRGYSLGIMISSKWDWA